MVFALETISCEGGTSDSEYLTAQSHCCNHNWMRYHLHRTDPLQEHIALAPRDGALHDGADDAVPQHRGVAGLRHCLLQLMVECALGFCGAP